MLRIRLHGRGGHGIKTAGRILGTSLFLEGFEVQDAPRYGAERRGAPIFAYVRASRDAVRERGVIHIPDLVAVADDTLLSVPAAGVRTGMDEHSLLFMHTDEPTKTWEDRLNLQGRVITLARLPAQDALYQSASVAGACARLLGVVSKESLREAVTKETALYGARAVEHSLRVGLESFDALAQEPRRVTSAALEGTFGEPDWVTLPLDPADAAAPAIHRALNSTDVMTGLWRSNRPVVDYGLCHGCHWMCATPCPDAAISLRADGKPQIDLDHCKGCLVCVASCPFHAIRVVDERLLAAEEPKT